MLVVVCCDGMIEMINRYGAKSLGYSEIDLNGGNWFEMIVPATVRENWLRVFELTVSGMSRIVFIVVRCFAVMARKSRFDSTILFSGKGCGNVTGVVFSGKIILEEEKNNLLMMQNQHGIIIGILSNTIFVHLNIN
jgi:PAS domain-containing protein